jgi:hypothetical protein
MSYKKKAWVLISAVLVLLAGLELAARFSGATDFPLYQVDTEIGYIPAKNQSGRFLNKNSWVFNEHHMGAGPFTPGPGLDTLLVGDSIVLGGNPLPQESRLGPQLSQQTASRVWPISAGSWSIANELKFFHGHPEVLAGIDQVVFVLNGGDLVDDLSHWRCDRNHPRRAPWSAAWYLLDKNILRLEDCETPKPAYAPPRLNWKAEMRLLLSRPEMQGKPVYAVLYPDLSEASQAVSTQAFERRMAQELAPFPELRLIRVGSDPRWQMAGHYRDGIHPTEAGNAVLAAIIRDGMSARP